MSDLPVTIGDLIVVGILLASGLLAFARGFVHETLAVGAWVGAIVAAFYLYPDVAPYAEPYLPDPRLANIAAGFAVFLVTIIPLLLLTRFLSKRVQGSALNALDRSLGFVFGLVRGALLVVLIYIGVDFLWREEQQPEWLREARSRPLVVEGADFLRSFVATKDVEEGAAAARKAVDSAGSLAETERMFRKMVSPEPKAEQDAGGPGTGGYGPKQRRDMERLIDSSGERP